MRPAEVAVAGPVAAGAAERPHGLVAEAETVERGGGGDPVERPQADGHAAFGELLTGAIAAARYHETL